MPNPAHSHNPQGVYTKLEMRGMYASLADESHRKAAIALNNTAVTLLTRGCARESVETLCDAVKIMRSAILDTDTKAPYSDSLSDGSIVRQALERSNRHISDGSICNATTATMPILQIISSQRNPSRILEMLTHSLSARVAFPMTIDLIDFDGPPSHDEVDFEAAVILYNYGLAMTCLATAVSDSCCATKSRELHKDAHQILKIAGSLLSGGYLDRRHLCSSLIGRIVLFRVVLLHSLMDVSIRLHLDVEYEIYSCDMEPVLSAVSILRLLVPVADQDVASAA